MDKVKEITYQVFVKHLFWTLSGVIILMAVVSWWMAASQMKDEYSSNRSDIESKHTKVDQVISKPATDRVNVHSQEGMAAKIEQRQHEVYIAWLKQYRKQREVLQWPDGLSSEFVERVDQLLQNRPIEERVKFEPDQPDPLVSRLREHYRNEIKSLLPSLAETIRADWDPAEITSTTGRGGREVATARETFRGDRGEGRQSETTDDGDPPVVDWSSSNQTEIVANHFDWQDQPSETPSTLQILYAQEDYQVLKALMQIIARTNINPKTGEPAHRPDQAMIREIETIEIGRSATRPIGSIKRMAGAALEEGEGSPAAMEGNPAAVTELYTGESGGEVVVDGDDPAEGRYVDKNYVPLPASTLRTAAESENQEEAYLAVAKRMPVRMRLTIDQRHLNRFLVECGNADLMLEIKQVRVFSGDARESSSSRTTRRGSSLFRGERSSETVSGGSSTENPWDISVEVYGLIYIFNPPSLKRLDLTLEEAAEIRKEANLEDDVSDAIVPESSEPSDDEDDDEESEEEPAEPAAAASLNREDRTPTSTG